MAQNALDLDVWKEIAITKQLLIKTATDALGLDTECTEEELKVALEHGVNKINEADDKVRLVEESLARKIADIEQKYKEADQARLRTQEALDQMTIEKEKFEALVETNRKLNVEETTRLKTQLDEKTKALKAINVTLGDTPQNVAKKIKTLNKKKHDDVAAKKRIEDELKNLKKDNREQIKKTDEASGKGKLVAAGYRELETYVDAQYDQLKELVEDADDLTAPPRLDKELLDALDEQKDEKKED